ncbi:helix-turn-helix domain-containing protein [Oceaniglobus trochenteri]|uniref:helix-turn-helix domain-containing protein n=1 Tax=Oceaniglobus trochenteri TaxID=2763260 RepID=UPI001CFF6767|nr:helix-turn-helix domain-containing protein [Oceaniglobus trochenteri]
MDGDFKANERALREIERLWAEADERACAAGRQLDVMDLARKFVTSVCAYEGCDVSVRHGSLGLTLDIWFEDGATAPASAGTTSLREAFQRSGHPFLAKRQADPVPTLGPGPAPEPAEAPADTASPDPAPEQDEIPAGPPAMGAAAVADGAGPDDGGPEPVASALPEAGGDASPSPDLIPAADPYSPRETETILKMHAAGASNGEIAAKLGRRAQGFHHAVTRIVAARVAPDGVSQKVWDRLETLGSTPLWQPDMDLMLAEHMKGGNKAGTVAQLMELNVQDVLDRWHAICPDRTVIGAIDALIVALKARVA